MDSPKVASWLQIIGNFGLIVGLVLVAVQIKQNNDLAKAQMLNDAYLDAGVQAMMRAGENPAVTLAKSITTPDQLTYEDFVVLAALKAAWWTRVKRIEDLTSAGYGYFSVEQFAHSAGFELGDPFELAWWDTYKNTPYVMSAPRTRAIIEQRFAESRGPLRSANLENYDAIMDRISSYLPQAK
jgi:hypothetical protein